MFDGKVCSRWPRTGGRGPPGRWNLLAAKDEGRWLVHTLVRNQEASSVKRCQLSLPHWHVHKCRHDVCTSFACADCPAGKFQPQRVSQVKKRQPPVKKARPPRENVLSGVSPRLEIS
jgi:hypothetical protein